MATDKTTRRSKKTPAPATRDDVVLKNRSDPRTEKRFEQKSSPAAIATVLAFSVASVLLGAGTYGQWIRDEALGPYKYAPWLFVAGAALFAVAALFGPRSSSPVRVGDAGVGLEKGPNEIDRIAWCDITKITLGDRGLTVKSEALSLAFPLPTMRAAVGMILREARARVPSLVEMLVPGELEKADASSGETVALEPPQVAGQKCKSSGKLIAFEKDARLCGRCGEIYHKDGVPKRCQTCDARLK